jgi:hypothetical protein
MAIRKEQSDLPRRPESLLNLLRLAADTAWADAEGAAGRAALAAIDGAASRREVGASRLRRRVVLRWAGWVSMAAAAAVLVTVNRSTLWPEVRAVEVAGVVTVDRGEKPNTGTQLVHHGRRDVDPDCEEVCIVCDADCDGSLTSRDIEAFALAMSNPSEYALQHPDCHLFCDPDTPLRNDIVTEDIGRFVNCLAGS